MMKSAVIGLIFFAGSVSQALAVEAQPTGDIKVQGSYYLPELDDKASHWALEMPGTVVGLTAYEQLDTSVINAVVDADLSVLANDESDIELRQAYLGWTQSAFSLSAGQLKTLEQSYIIDYASHLKSQERGGLQAAKTIETVEADAVRLTAQSGEYLVFSGQIKLDSDADKNPWGLATVATTSEGSVSLTYRRVPDESPLWGNQITWVSGNVSLTGAYMIQDGITGYDLGISMTSDATVAFFGYSRDTDEEEKRWQVGVHQMLSDAVTSYSELMWWPDDSQWLWSTGFEMVF